MRIFLSVPAAIAAGMIIAAGLAGPGSAQETGSDNAAKASSPGGMPPQQPVEYRRHVKNAMQEHLSAFGLILTFRAPHEEHFALHAEALADLAEAHKSLYPAGSGSDASSPRIWQEPEAFDAALQRTADAAAKLRDTLAMQNRHAILNVYTRLSESCEACHNNFRVAER